MRVVTRQSVIVIDTPRPRAVRSKNWFSHLTWFHFYRRWRFWVDRRALPRDASSRSPGSGTTGRTDNFQIGRTCRVVITRKKVTWHPPTLPNHYWLHLPRESKLIPTNTQMKWTAQMLSEETGSQGTLGMRRKMCCQWTLICKGKRNAMARPQVFNVAL